MPESVRALIGEEEEAQENCKKALSGSDAVSETFKHAHELKSFGVALSGGGIRSATFSLGVLQGLAERKLLRHVDYLSTVSGGGYIGSWLVAWIFRKARDPNRLDNQSPVETVEEDLHPELAQQRQNFSGPRKEPHPVRFLRDYSNYLTPRRGLLGADAWAASAIYLRNLLLNLGILVFTLSALLVLPKILVLAYHSSESTPLVIPWGWPIVIVSVLTAALLVVAAWPYSARLPGDLRPGPSKNTLRAMTMPATAVSLIIVAILLESLWIHYRPYAAIRAPLVIGLLLITIAIVSIEHSTSVFLHPWWERRRIIGSFKAPAAKGETKAVAVRSFDAYMSKELAQKFGALEKGDWIEIWDKDFKNERTSAGGVCVAKLSSITNNESGSKNSGETKNLELRTEVQLEGETSYYILTPDRKTQRLSQRQVLLTAVLPMIAGACYLTAWLHSIALSELGGPGHWAIRGLLIYSLIWIVALLYFSFEQLIRAGLRAKELQSATLPEEQDKPENVWCARFATMRRELREELSRNWTIAWHSGWRACGLWLWACAPVTGAVAGLSLFELRRLFSYWAHGLAGLWNSFSWGVPLVILLIFVLLTLHLGWLGSCYEDHWREWWGRFSGFLLLGGLNWAALFALAVYAPLAVVWLKWWVTGLVSAGWIASTITGVLKGFSASTGKQSNNKLVHKALLFTPHVFVVGLMVLLAFSLQMTLVHTISCEGSDVTGAVLDQFLHKDSSQWPSRTLLYPMLYADSARIGPWSWPLESHSPYVLSHWCLLNMTLNRKLILFFGVCLALAALLAWRVDVNEFSMQMLYRNRLVRCYLGASHLDRLPNFFTGFDPYDDLRLWQMHSNAGYDGPIPILNTSLNLVRGEELAWQERKAESFTYTPLYSGFDVWLEKRSRDYQQATHHLERYGYRRTALFSYPQTYGPFLGTAMGISGAALSPNMGYHSNPALAFLMTLFDVRLGWWVGNTRNPNTWYSAGPTFGLFWLIRELLGYTNDHSPYVYLSDGGHFENLGLYELVKRRCKYIIVSDAGEDPDLKFGDLGNAIRKVRDDFGIEIEIDTTPISDKQRHFAVGTVHYEFADGKPKPDDYGKPRPVKLKGEEILVFKARLEAWRKAQGWPEEQKSLQGTIVVLKPTVLQNPDRREPADILSFQKGHPSFPNQSTADQWFTESQFESYRRLGQHIVCGMCEPIDLNDNKNALSGGKGTENREILAGMFNFLRQKYSSRTYC